MRLLVGLWFLVGVARAQDAGLQTYAIPDHTGGLHSYYSGQRLQKNQATDIINGFLDKDLGVVKRNGQSNYGTISGCSAQVRAGASFKTSGGADYFFAVCGGQTYVTTGDGSFAAIGSSINATNRVRFAQGLGKEWVVDGVDPTWFTDGVTVSSPTQAVAAVLVGSYKSRIALANWAGNKSSVFLSGFANGSDYTIPAVIIDTSPALFYLNGPNDGRGVTCLFDGYKDVLILFNEDQMFGLYGNGYNTFVLRKLAEVGCSEQESMREYEGKLKWLSKYGVYEYNGANATRISDPVKDYVTSIIATDSSVQSLVQTLQADFSAGNLTASGLGAPMSATISPGNVVPSTMSIVENTAIKWVAGELINVSTSIVPGQLTLLQGTSAYFRNMGAESGSGTENWTFDDPTHSHFLNIENAAHPTYTTMYGSNMWEVGTAGSCSGTFGLEVLDSNNSVIISSVISPAGLVIDQVVTMVLNTQAVTTPQEKVRISFTDAAVTATSALFVKGTTIVMQYYGAVVSGSCRLRYDFPENGTGGITGSYKSQMYDTGFSTPTFGRFLATTNADAASTIIFQTQVSSAATGSLDNAVTVTTATKIGSASKRFIRSISTMTMTLTTDTPLYVSNLEMQAATTGYFISQCFNVGNITSWDLFQVNSVPNGGVLSLAVSTGASCNMATRSTNTWTTQVNNSVISIATASFLGVRGLFNIDSASQTLTLQDITVNYVVGAGRPPLASIIYDNRYWIAFSTNTSGTAYNDTILVYDRNGNWTKLKGINASSLWLYKRQLYSGSGLSDGKVNIQDLGSTDLGSNIDFRFKTPDLDLDSLSRKSLYDLTTEFLPTTNAGSAATIQVNYYADKSTSAYSLGTFSTYQASNGILYDIMRFGKAVDPILVRTISLEYLNSSVNPITLYRSWLRYLPLDTW